MKKLEQIQQALIKANEALEIWLENDNKEMIALGHKPEPGMYNLRAEKLPEFKKLRNKVLKLKTYRNKKLKQISL